MRNDVRTAHRTPLLAAFAAAALAASVPMVTLAQPGPANREGDGGEMRDGPSRPGPGGEPDRPRRFRGPWRDGMAPPGYGPGGYGPGGFRGRYESVDPDEWNRVAAFAGKYSPHRFKALEQLPRDAPHYDAIRRMMVGRYRMLSEVEREDPELFLLRVRQLQLEDDVFGGIRPRDDGAPPAGGSVADDPALRQKVAELVDLNLQERKRRLDKLEAMVADQRKQLARDEGERERLTSERLARIEKEGVKALMPDPPPGRGPRRGQGAPGREGDGPPPPPPPDHGER